MSDGRLRTPTTDSVFRRYEELRPRLPAVETEPGFRDISSLLDIADEASAFVFDAFGVLNVGETPIEGAGRRIDELRERGRRIRILTNAASYDRRGAVAKFRRLGLSLEDDEIITSRDAALAALTPGLWGAIAAADDELADIGEDVIRLGDARADFDRVDGFLFLSSSGWTEDRQALLTSSLSRRDRPVIIANADLAAPRDDGFSLEPGYFGHALADRGFDRVRFFGKPYPDVYDLAERSLPGVAPDAIVMCGDALHTDILGAASRGWRSVLVTRDGLFSGRSTDEFCEKSRIFPDWRLPRI